MQKNITSTSIVKITGTDNNFSIQIDSLEKETFPKNYNLEKIGTSSDAQKYYINIVNSSTGYTLLENLKVNQFQINGASFTNYNDLSAASTSVLFKKGGGAGVGGAGWTETYILEEYNGKLIKKITGYTGGIGNLPTELSSNIGLYIGDKIVTSNKDLAVNFRGVSGVNAILPFSTSTFPLVAPTPPAPPIQRTHKNSIWQLKDGETANVGDVPNENSLIWKSLIPKYHSKEDYPLVQLPDTRYIFDTSTDLGWTANAVQYSTAFDFAPALPEKKYYIGVDSLGPDYAISFWTDKKGRVVKLITDADIVNKCIISPKDAGRIYLGTAADPTPFKFRLVDNVLLSEDLSKYSVSLNLSNGFLLEYFVTPSGFNTPNQNANMGAVSNYIKLDSTERNYFIILPNSGATNISRTCCFYDENFELISHVAFFTAEYGTSFITAPANAVYCKFTVHHYAEGNVGLIEIGFIRSRDHKEVDKFLKTGTLPKSNHILSSSDIFKIAGDTLFSEEVIVGIGDSNMATGYGGTQGLGNAVETLYLNGGYVRYIINRLAPKAFYNMAVGGWTISDETPDLTGNSFVKIAKNLIDLYDAGTIKKPTIIIINGGTNDFDSGLSRYVTDAEFASKGYDKYCEEEFISKYKNSLGDTEQYDNYYLIDKSLINKAKIIGAIRYIVEILKEKFPSVKFYICTPLKSSNHTPMAQRRTVRDIKWIAERLSIPIIDIHNSGNMIPLFDMRTSPDEGDTLLFPTNPRYILDGVHYFNGAGQVSVAAKMIANKICQEIERTYYDEDFGY